MVICGYCSTEKLENESNVFYHPKDTKNNINICNNCLKSDINLHLLVTRYDSTIFEHMFSYMEIAKYMIGKSNSKI